MLYSDALLLTVGDCVTSVFAGFAVFSILGFLSTELGTSVDQVAKEG